MEQLSSKHLNSPQPNSPLTSGDQGQPGADINSSSFMSDFAEASHDLLMDESPTARAGAAHRLALLGRPLAAPYLVAALSDESWEVRQAAVESLSDIGTADALAPLQDLLARGNQDALLQRAISQAIETISARAGSAPAVGPAGEVSQAPSQLKPVEHREAIPAAEAKELPVAPNRDHAEAEARLRAAKEKQVAFEIEALRQAEAEQGKKIAEAHEQSRRRAELEPEKRARGEAEQKTAQEVERVKTFESEKLRAQARVAQTLDHSRELQAAIEVLRHEELLHAEKVKQQAAVIEALQVQIDRAVNESRVRAAKEQELSLMIEELRAVEAEDLPRLQAAESVHQKAKQEAEARLQQCTVLEDELRSIQSETSQPANREQQLSAEIENLRRAEAEQKARITNIEDARPELEQALQLVSSQALLAAETHAQTVAELESLRQTISAAAESRTATEQHLSEQIAALRTAEAEQLRRIEAARASLHAHEQARKQAEEKAQLASRRAEAEANQLVEMQLVHEKNAGEVNVRAAEKQRLSVEIESLKKVANEQIALMDDAKTRLTALEEARKRAETKVRQRAERETRLQSEIEALHQTSEELSERINHAEAEDERLRVEKKSMIEAAEARRQLEAEARAAAAEVEQRSVAEDAERRAAEEQDNLNKLQAIRAKAEVAAARRSEQERELNATLEKLSYAAVEQLTRIQSAEVSLRDAEAKARRLSEEETQAHAALVAQQKAEQANQAQAAEAARAELQAAHGLRAQQEQEQIATLESMRAQSELDAQQRANIQQELNRAIESLKESESKQSQEISDLQTEAQHRAEQEERRLAELESIRKQNALAAQQRADREQKLTFEIEAMRAMEVEQSNRVTELQASLVSLEEQRLKTEAKAKQKTEREQNLTADILALREAIAAQVNRIADATEESRRLAAEQARLNDEEEARRRADAAARNRIAEEFRGKTEHDAGIRAQQEQEQLARLQSILTKAEEETSARGEIERQLKLDIETLRRSEIEQRRRISQAEAELREAQTQALSLAEEQLRLRTEAETLNQEQARKRRAGAEEMRLLVENDAQQRAREEIRQLEELEAIRSRAESEALRRVESEQQLNAGIEALRKAEALQLKRIAAAEVESQKLVTQSIQLRAAEEARLHAESEAHEQSLNEQLRAEELHAQQLEQRELAFVKQVEDIRSEAEKQSQQRNERVELVNAEIAALQTLEVSQIREIHDTEMRLAEFQAACDRLNEEAAHLAAEDRARREAFAAERQGKFEDALAAAQAEERGIEAEQRQRNALLEKRQAELIASVDKSRSSEAKLAADTQALEEQQAEQRNRIKQSEAAIVARQTELETAALEASRRAIEDKQHIAELQSQLSETAAQSQADTATAKELRLALEKQRKTHVKQNKDLEKLAARRDQAETEFRDHAARAAELLAEIESLQTKIDQSENEWPETELKLKSQLEALRKAESIQTKRFQKLASRIESEKQKIGESAATRTKTRSTRSAVKSTSKAKGAPVQHVELWFEILTAIRNKTETEVSNRSTKEHELQAELQALLNAEVEQLARIEETRARVKERADVAIESAEQASSEISSSLEVEAIQVESSMPEFVAQHDSGAVVVSEVADGEFLQPLETWQFAMIDEPQPQISELDVPAVTASVQDELSTEPLAAETELEATLRELARLDEVNFAQQSTEIELANVQEDTVAPASIEIELAEPKHFVASEKAIQSYDEDSSLARLIENIKTGNTTQRSAAVRELIQTDEEQAFRIITGLFDDGLVDVRNAAALALFQFKRDCAASFTRALREASPERRGHIAAAINGSGLAAQAVDNLIGESREKTYDAFSMLFLMARAGEVKVLLKTIEQHPEVAVRLSVIKLLTFCNQPNIIPAFRSLAVRGTLPTEVRSAVMEAIYQISSNSRENSQSAA